MAVFYYSVTYERKSKAKVLPYSEEPILEEQGPRITIEILTQEHRYLTITVEQLKKRVKTLEEQKRKDGQTKLENYTLCKRKNKKVKTVTIEYEDDGLKLKTIVSSFKDGTAEECLSF